MSSLLLLRSFIKATRRSTAAFCGFKYDEAIQFFESKASCAIVPVDVRVLTTTGFAALSITSFQI